MIETLKIIDNESEIKKAQLRFASELEKFVDERIRVSVGYMGGSTKKTVSWSSKLGIWMLIETISGSRYWNAFKIGKPQEGSNVSITCEINFPLKRRDRRIAGSFAKNSLGNLYVVHSGKIGGGRKGIGKKLFHQHYRGEWVFVDDGEAQSKVALIGALDSPRFARQVSQFVSEVARIKKLAQVQQPRVGKSEGFGEFAEEFAGKKHYRIRKNVEAECDHGLIVNDLAHTLQNLGFTVDNDRNRDLFIIGPEATITSLFEIKTDVSTSSLYSGVGQLLLNGTGLVAQPKMILTIPNRLSKTLESKLKELGIQVLVFEWHADKAVFPTLKNLI